MPSIQCEFMCSEHSILGAEIKIRRPDNYICLDPFAKLLDQHTPDIYNSKWFETRAKKLEISNPVEVYHGGTGVKSWMHPKMALECALRNRRAVVPKLECALNTFRLSEKYTLFPINARLMRGVEPPEETKVIPEIVKATNRKISSEVVAKGFGYSRYRDFMHIVSKHQEYLGAEEVRPTKNKLGGDGKRIVYFDEYQICLLPAICGPTKQVKEFQKRLVNSFWALRNLKNKSLEHF